MKLDVYLPSANNNFSGVLLGASGFTGYTVIDDSEKETNLSTEDAWQTLRLIFQPSTDVVAIFYLLGNSLLFQFHGHLLLYHSFLLM